MRKVIISIASLLALSTSSLSFAWGHGGGWNHQHGFNPLPYVIAGAVIGAGGVIAYNSVPALTMLRQEPIMSNHGLTTPRNLTWFNLR